MTKYAVQLFKASNDRNGNPRRIWVAYDLQTGAAIETYDEGYRGSPRFDRNTTIELIGPISVGATEYKEIKRFSKERNHVMYCRH